MISIKRSLREVMQKTNSAESDKGFFYKKLMLR
jgi:hypothetical protein